MIVTLLAKGLEVQIEGRIELSNKEKWAIITDPKTGETWYVPRKRIFSIQSGEPNADD